MAAVALSTRLGTISRNGRSGGYDGNPVAFEDGELRLIQRGLGQVLESLDCVDCKSCGQTAVADVDPGGTVLVHPTSFPTTVFLLEREKGAKVQFVPDPD